MAIAFKKCNLLLLYVSVSLIAIGCGGSGDRPDLGRVTGVVTMDDKPLSNAKVYFWPKEGGRTSESTTDSAGKYELQYTLDAKGAQVGMCEVRVSTALDEQADEEGNVTQEAKDETVPAKYNDETELSFEVKPGDNTYDIKLKSGG